MAKSIEPNLRKIGDYLKLDDDVVFTIPEYQRAYSWTIDHCDKLWTDIIDFCEGDNKDNYFFGTIIINCQDHDSKYGLIDGQQRTTTFLLLLKALLMRINTAILKMGNDEESESLRKGLRDRRTKIMSILYKLDVDDVPDKPDIERDAGFCNNVNLLDNYSINEQYKNELKTILKAVEYIQAEQNVIKIPYRQKDNKYTNFFRNFKFFYETASELSDSQLNSITKSILEKCEVIEIKSWQVEQAITMFNSLNSDGLPLFDSDIISAKLYAAAEKQGKREDFTKLWEEFLIEVSKLKQLGIANVDSILMQHMYFERTRRKETISDTGSINVTTPGLRRYYTEINKEIIDDPMGLCNQMINLTRIWNKVSNYPSVQVLLKFNENAKLFLASYFYRFKADEISEEKIISVVESLMKLFVIAELVDVGYSSKYFKMFLFGEETKMIEANISEQEIVSDFKNHILSNWNIDSIKEEILEYDKHMLVYLNEYLFAKENDVYFDLSDKYDIEHIMPYSGNNIQIIRKDAGIESEEEFKGIVNKLGNKILLEDKINRSIGNEWFRTKVSTTLKDKTGYINSKYPIANFLVSKYEKNQKPYWTKNDIKEATEIACNRIANFIFDNE